MPVPNCPHGLRCSDIVACIELLAAEIRAMEPPTLVSGCRHLPVCQTGTQCAERILAGARSPEPSPAAPEELPSLDIESEEEYAALRAAAETGPYRVDSQRERLMHLHGWIGGRSWERSRSWRFQYRGKVYTNEELFQVIDILASIMLSAHGSAPSEYASIWELLPAEYRPGEDKSNGA